jgi:hypothetical protein
VTARDADPACPGSTVVLTTLNCEVILDRIGFWVRCTAPGCTYVSERTPSKPVARRWANAHDEGLTDQGAGRGVRVGERARPTIMERCITAPD